MIERLKTLKSKKYSSATELSEALKKDTGLRNEINALSRHFLRRSVSGCNNCFFDAYMELINLKNMEKSKFQIKRGAVLYDPINQDVSKILTAANCTDELALYHLKFNPNSRKYFSELPEDIEELIENFKTGTKTTKPAKQEKAEKKSAKTTKPAKQEKVEKKSAKTTKPAKQEKVAESSEKKDITDDNEKPESANTETGEIGNKADTSAKAKE